MTWYRLNPDHTVEKISTDEFNIPEGRLNTDEERTVARTNVTKNTYVSTVFLGLDHGFGNSHVPILFETMSFGNEVEEVQQRYTNWDEAIAGHNKVVSEIRIKLRIPEPTPPKRESRKLRFR